MTKMVKNRAPQKVAATEMQEALNFFEGFEGSGSESTLIGGMMDSLIGASNEQLKIAVELTKLVISQNPDQANSQEAIFSTYQSAAKIVAESYSLKTLIESTLSN